MDAATVLEEYLADLTNLPTDLAYILDEIQSKEQRLMDAQTRIANRDGAIQKHIKLHGSLAENPKEAASYPRIRSDFQESVELQQDKVNLANTGLYIISRQVKKLNDQIRQLEDEGLLAPAVSDEEEAKLIVEPARTTHVRRQSELKRPAPSRDKTPSTINRPLKRQRTDPRTRPGNSDEQEATYCICQQGSYGEMVACDNPDCRFEWFHWECVGLTEPPTGAWFCPDCRKK